MKLPVHLYIVEIININFLLIFYVTNLLKMEQKVKYSHTSRNSYFMHYAPYHAFLLTLKTLYLLQLTGNLICIH